MKILVNAGSLQYEQLLAKGIPDQISCVVYQPGMALDADAYFDLTDESGSVCFADEKQKPVFVNAVIPFNKELAANQVRINAWPGFFERGLLELAKADTDFFSAATAILDQLGWKYQLAPDTPGMISARVVAMIINEAYFALGEKISTPEEIDTAMRAGTNYPFGPFEWAQKIGVKNIYALLKKLGAGSTRYSIAPALAAII